MDRIAVEIAGWSFLAASAMLRPGAALLPAKLGTFIDPRDFARIDDVLHRTARCST